MSDRSEAHGDSHITIPPEALRAARAASMNARGDGVYPVEAACLAMLRAWPGMEYMMGDEAFPFHYIILPLPQEASDE